MQQTPTRVEWPPYLPADDAPGPAAGEAHLAARILTSLIVFGPLLGLVAALVALWGNGVGKRDVAIALAMYAITGHGVTVGFHRLLAHRSFRAVRPLRIATAIAGSMAFEGPVIGWVADHRRHHAFTDVEGDPHSPHRYGEGFGARVHGLWHAHIGWLFEHDPTSQTEYAGDLLLDPDLPWINRLFPLWCVASLAIPFGLGWLLGGTLHAAATALLWGGAVRICVLHHVTWSINSVCHTFGRRPFRTHDRSTNVAALGVLSFGESFHNAHHTFPYSARFGLKTAQLDSSAGLVDLFARFGWATNIRRPSTERIQALATNPPR